MKTKGKMALLAALAAASIVLATAVGSVHIPVGDILAILADRLFGAGLPEGVRAVYPAMVMDMRLPRVLLAFLTGAALAMSGTVMQSVLQNPLASPFGLGVSSGAGLGAAIVIVTGLAAGPGALSSGWGRCFSSSGPRGPSTVATATSRSSSSAWWPAFFSTPS